jgi:hypothetical protein
MVNISPEQIGKYIGMLIVLILVVTVIMGIVYPSMVINDLKENKEVYRIAIATLVFSCLTIAIAIGIFGEDSRPFTPLFGLISMILILVLGSKANAVSSGHLKNVGIASMTFASLSLVIGIFLFNSVGFIYAFKRGLN